MAERQLRDILQEELTAELRLPLGMLTASNDCPIEIVSNTTILVPRGRKIDLDSVFSTSLENCDILERLNPNLSFELIDRRLVIQHIVSSVSANVGCEILRQLTTFNKAGAAFPFRGCVHSSKVRWLCAPRTFRRASASIGFYVTIPAATIVGTAMGHAIPIDHADFILTK
eukprot:TRINITY_DN4063_c0_g1_i1.p1 TRINITY_DN4063_c0_g1~~TRINITY_DN4063_c0_g1_i1.p1  ORF type:complete len:171 (+),score=22.97 TRINITY_DN4063_c0_g1_i1:366-878(+)